MSTETEAALDGEPLDLDQPQDIDAAWVALALPSGTMTRTALRDAGWDTLPEEVQQDAIDIIEAQTGP